MADTKSHQWEKMRSEHQEMSTKVEMLGIQNAQQEKMTNMANEQVAQLHKQLAQSQI